MPKLSLHRAPIAQQRGGNLVGNSLIAVVMLGFLVLYVPTIITTPVSTWSDGGLFYSVFHQLSQGQRLYAEVFEIKDPLFFYLYSVSYLVFGFPGPMLWESLLTVASVILLLSIATTAGLGKPARAFVLSVFALLYFLPTIYYPLHTFHQSVVFFLLAVRMLLSRQPFWAGCACAAAVLSKLPMSALLPAVLWLALFGPEGVRHRRQVLSRGLLVLAGFSIATACVVGVLILRGELSAYLEVISFNLSYPALHARSDHDFRLFASTTGLWERTTTLFTNQVVVALVLAVIANAALATLVWRRRNPVHDRQDPWSSCNDEASILRLSVFAILVFAGSCALLSVVSLWHHHFQLFGLVFAFSLMPGLLWARDASRKGVSRGSLVIMGSMVAVLLSSGLLQEYWQRETLGNAPPMGGVLPGTTGRRFADERRRFLAESECLRRTLEPFERASFAVVQQNRSGALAALTPPNLRLGCRVFSQWPWFSRELLEEFATCLQDRETRVVLQGPFWARLPDLESRIESTLRRDFMLVNACRDTQVWARHGGP